jgi:dienelactone hydrolase
MECHRFDVSCEGRTVPGVVWTSSLEMGRPLILLGHGGGGDKMAVAPLAEMLVVGGEFVAAAIDGPVHGDRRSDDAGRDQVLADFRALWGSGTPHIDDMVADWRAALDHLCELEEVDPSRVGWGGVSMGTAYGLPVVAGEPRISAAVLGQWGLSYPYSERLRADAPRVTCPVLFQRKTEDELFTAAGQEELFGLIGARDKRMATYPGSHGLFVEAQVTEALAFLRTHLC